MPKRCKGIFIIIAAILLLQAYLVSACGPKHFDVESNWKIDFLPDISSFTDIGGILKINGQTRTCDEIGVFYKGICVGRTTVESEEGIYVLHIFNYTAFKDGVWAGDNGPTTSSVLEVRIWDAQSGVEVKPGTQGYTVNILDSAVKNSAGNLIYKPNTSGKWRVDITYTMELDVTQVVPSQSYTGQSQEITITGKNFAQGAKVFIGTTELSSVIFQNSTTLKATVPATIPEGTYDLTVTVGALSRTLTGVFKVLAKQATKINRLIPNRAINDGVTPVTVVGLNLMEGSTVKIGNAKLTNLVYSGDHMTIDGDVPMGIPAGIYTVTVIGPGGETCELARGFTVIQGKQETMNLVPGLNFVAYPSTAPASYKSYDFVSDFFSPQTMDSLWYYKNQDDRWEVTFWDNDGYPSGDNFAIENGKGYLLYSKVNDGPSFPGWGSPFETQLYRGTNVVSFSLPGTSSNYTSYDLIQYMLNQQLKVVAIQKYERESGRWQITFGLSGQPVGDKFSINKDESYVVYMKE
ncbi:MAG: IPT/TIG domain-containing protein, partial [Spirochaetota bacterium]